MFLFRRSKYHSQKIKAAVVIQRMFKNKLQDRIDERKKLISSMNNRINNFYTVVSKTSDGKVVYFKDMIITTDYTEDDIELDYIFYRQERNRIKNSLT